MEAEVLALTSEAGAPVCMMNDFMIRWTGVPSYWPEAHKARKLRAVFGTASQNISSLISPRVVCNYELVRFIFSKSIRACCTYSHRHGCQGENEAYYLLEHYSRKGLF